MNFEAPNLRKEFSVQVTCKKGCGWTYDGTSKLSKWWANVNAYKVKRLHEILCTHKQSTEGHGGGLVH